MLFDLRGRGRRRTIQGIYLFLALLMGGGLVFFGVGGTGVGLFNTDNNGQTPGVSSDAVKKAEQSVKAHPQQAAAWAELARRRFQNADYDSNRQIFTDPAQLQQVSVAFNRYRALDKGKAKPDTGLLQQMVQVYSERGLQQYANAVPVLEDITAADPSASGNFQQLAVYARVAGQTRKADLAEQKALSLVDGKAAVKGVKQNIAQQVSIIKQLQAAQSGQTGGATPAPSTPATPAPGG